MYQHPPDLASGIFSTALTLGSARLQLSYATSEKQSTDHIPTQLPLSMSATATRSAEARNMVDCIGHMEIDTANVNRLNYYQFIYTCSSFHREIASLAL
jgi:hypothetical protein